MSVCPSRAAAEVISPPLANPVDFCFCVLSLGFPLCLVVVVGLSPMVREGVSGKVRREAQKVRRPFHMEVCDCVLCVSPRGYTLSKFGLRLPPLSVTSLSLSSNGRFSSLDISNFLGGVCRHCALSNSSVTHPLCSFLCVCMCVATHEGAAVTHIH